MSGFSRLARDPLLRYRRAGHQWALTALPVLRGGSLDRGAEQKVTLCMGPGFASFRYMVLRVVKHDTTATRGF